MQYRNRASFEGVRFKGVLLNVAAPLPGEICLYGDFMEKVVFTNV